MKDYKFKVIEEGYEMVFYENEELAVVFTCVPVQIIMGEYDISFADSHSGSHQQLEAVTRATPALLEAIIIQSKKHELEWINNKHFRK